VNRKERRAARARGAIDIFGVATPQDESPLVRDLIHRIVRASSYIGDDHASCATACWYVMGAHIATIPDEDLRNDAIKFFAEGLGNLVEFGRAQASKVEMAAADKGKTLLDLVVEGGDGVVVRSETEH
jgi:hypothetical protein